jgi:Tfp pilus assembly protein PilN
MAPQRAAALALSELRLPPDTAPVTLETVLPKPVSNPVENDLGRNPMPYATALAGACPWMAPAANVLPKEMRRLNSRMLFVPTMVLASIAVLLTAGIWAYSAYADRQYLAHLNTLIEGVSARAQRAGQLDRQFDEAQARVKILDRYREQTRSDLDALNELTRLIAPPAWTSVVDLDRDKVTVSGEAQQAATLPQIISASPLFQGAKLDMANPIPGGVGESFQIQAARRKQ